MKSKDLRFHEEAILDAGAAKEWYLERSPQAATSFIAELERGLTRIQEAPHRWPKFGEASRRFVMPRFPFSIIFRITNDIEIVAVAHDKRRPGFWRSR